MTHGHHDLGKLKQAAQWTYRELNKWSQGQGSQNHPDGKIQDSVPRDLEHFVRRWKQFIRTFF